MKAYRAIFPLAVMCLVLDLSLSGHYDWLHRGPSARVRRDAELQAQDRGDLDRERRDLTDARGSTRRSWPKASGWAGSGWHA